MPPKRLTWLGIGFVAGLGWPIVVKRKLRRRLAPLAGGRSALGQLRLALEEGRSAMAEREAELRRHLRPRLSQPALKAARPGAHGPRTAPVGLGRR